MRLYELLRTLREGDDLVAADVGAIVERGLSEVGRLESAGLLDADAAARWRDALAAEAAVPRDGAVERSTTAGLRFGSAHFGGS